MSFTVSKEKFRKKLELVSKVIGKQPYHTPFYTLMEWKDNSLCIIGTNLETTIKEELSIQTKEDGKAFVSLKKLYEIVKEFPEGDIEIEKNNDVNQVILKCEKSKFYLTELDPKEFPLLPSYNEESFTKIPSYILKDMIEKTAYAASIEESRYNFNGVYIIQIKEGEKNILRMVATDGYRLSLVDREIEKIRGIEEGIIIPKGGIIGVKRFLKEIGKKEEIDIYFDKSNGFFKAGKSLMIIKLIENGRFPEYEDVILRNNDKKLLIGRDKLYSSLRRVSTMASEIKKGIRIKLKNNLMELSPYYHNDCGNAIEEIDIFYEGPPLEMRFNAKYLMEALNTIEEDQILIELKDEGGPCLIRPNIISESQNQLCVIMPMRF